MLAWKLNFQVFTKKYPTKQIKKKKGVTSLTNKIGGTKFEHFDLSDVPIRYDLTKCKGMLRVQACSGQGLTTSAPNRKIDKKNLLQNIFLTCYLHEHLFGGIQ